MQVTWLLASGAAVGGLVGLFVGYCHGYAVSLADSADQLAGIGRQARVLAQLDGPASEHD